jgi:hypothetical protein
LRILPASAVLGIIVLGSEHHCATQDGEKFDRHDRDGSYIVGFQVMC